MAEVFLGFVRRFDLEPKKDFLGIRTYAHVFLKDAAMKVEIDVYTDEPRYEAVFLAAYTPAYTPERNVPPRPRLLEVYYEEVAGIKKVVRVILDREFK